MWSLKQPPTMDVRGHGGREQPPTMDVRGHGGREQPPTMNVRGHGGRDEAEKAGGDEEDWLPLDGREGLVGPDDNDGIIGWRRFRPVIVKEAIHQVLMETLQGKDYNSEECTDLTKSLSDQIKAKLRELGYDRYKFIVQVVIGEQRGEGVKMGCRCFWDSDTDNYAQDIFMNDTLFCVAAAFAVFYY